MQIEFWRIKETQQAWKEHNLTLTTHKHSRNSSNVNETCKNDINFQPDFIFHLIVNLILLLLFKSHFVHL